MNRYKTLLISILMLTGLLFTVEASGDRGAPSSAVVSGTISYMEGDVFLNGKPAEIGDRVDSRDTLETGESSFCEVVFENANVFRLDELTQTKIDWAKSNIVVEKGGFSAVFNKLDKLLNEMRDFTITTKTTVAGVRGTVFYVKVEDEKNSYVCICNGTLAMDYSGTEMDISATHHKAYRFTESGGKVTWSDAPMLYHDDAKMDEIAARIGFTIPWGTEKGYSY